MIDLLLMRFVLLQGAAGTLVALGWERVVGVYEADSTWITTAILVLLAGGLVDCWRRVVECCWMLNGIERNEHRGRVREFLETEREDVLRVKLDSRLRPIEHVAHSLLLVGFLGTVYGFRVALGGVDPMSAADVTAIAPMVATLLEGMGIAIPTTIAGLCGYLWLRTSALVLEGGYDRLYTRCLEL